CFDQPIVDVAHDPDLGPGGHDTVLLMRDVGAHMVPEGDEPLPLAHHRSFVEHMARLHAAFLGFDDRWELVTPMQRYFELSPWTGIVEAELGGTTPVPQFITKGWAAFGDVAPRSAA